MSRLTTTRPPHGYLTHVPRHLVHTDEFPLLDFRELSQCLQECDFDASEELVSRPSGAYMRKLFEQILDTFIGLSPDYCGATARGLLHSRSSADGSTGAAGDENDDTNEAVHVLVFFRAVSMFLQRCGVQDFTLLDLVRPESARTQRVLSGVINFARFREEHLRECEPLAKEAEEAMQELRSLDEATTELANRIDNLRARLDDSNAGSALNDALLGGPKPSLQQLHKYNAKLEQELIRLQKSQEVFKKEHASYRETKARLIEKLEDQHFLLSEAERELQKIEGYASADPAVVRQIVEDLRLHSQTAEAELRKAEAAVRNKTRTQQSVQAVEDELRNIMKIVLEITNDTKALDAARDSLARQHDELASKQQISRELEVHLDRARRQAQKCEEKIAKLRQQAREKEQGANEKFVALEAEYEVLTRDRDAKQERLDRTKRENMQIEQEILKMRLDFENESRSTATAVAKLNAHIRQYLEDISGHL